MHAHCLLRTSVMSTRVCVDEGNSPTVDAQSRFIFTKETTRKLIAEWFDFVKVVRPQVKISEIAGKEVFFTGSVLNMM